ncbi:MAG: ABC transporter permease [Fimbriimonadales bacterium]|nr:ABC transporter permease [Armatimonadota bacterium]MCX7688023.1 ABC transporter permease [Fimbriimonadales bacterium]CUU38477.1 putative ABC transport system permease protein [Armatimonadetes bacterium DC]
MGIWESFRVALETLRAHKLRSLLTMLGVIFGVMAVVVMVAMIEGARASVVQEFEKLGSDVIIVAFDPTERIRREERGGTVEGLQMSDLEAIRALPELRVVTAERGLGQKEVVYQGEKLSVTVTGVGEDYLTVRALNIAQGRFFEPYEFETGEKVAVLGYETAQKLFGKQDPIGKDILLDGTQVRVIGVLEKRGRTFGENQDEVVYIPLTAALKRWAGDEQLSVILAMPHSREQTPQALDAIWETLMRLHNNQPDFRVDTLESILNAISRVISMFGVLLGGIAGLALLVGGIGIMNIMLVSVTERTREIGLRKAVGAQKWHILVQFLIESATLATIGGLIGMALGWGFGEAIEWLTRQSEAFGENGLNFYFPIWAGIGAFLFSASVGVVFGLYPAWRAANLDPIVALRYE